MTHKIAHSRLVRAGMRFADAGRLGFAGLRLSLRRDGSAALDRAVTATAAASVCLAGFAAGLAFLPL